MPALPGSAYAGDASESPGCADKGVASESACSELGSDSLGAQASRLPSPPGTILAVGEAVEVACGPDGNETLQIIEVQPANKSRMKARDWANGARVTAGTVLG